MKGSSMKKSFRYPEAELDTIDELPPASLVTVHETAALADLARMFVEQFLVAIGVVDDEERLIGVITRTDLLGNLGNVSATAVDAMSGLVFLESDSTIECAAALMVLEGVGHVIVMSPRGEPYGVVSALDIARHIAARAGYLAA